MPSINLQESLNAKLLNSKNAFKNLYDISGGYGKLTQVVTMINLNSGSVQANTVDGIYEKLTIGHQAVISKIQTRTISGTNLKLDFYDTSYKFFRNDDVVMDNNRMQGKVIAHVPGQIIISPLSEDAFVSANFAEDYFALRTWDSSANRGSTGKESLYAVPDTIFNYGSIKRDSVFNARRDFHETYMDGVISKKNWTMMQEVVLRNRVAQSIEQSYLFETRQKKDVNGEEVNQNGTLEWAINNRGGTHTTSSNPLTETTWQEAIAQVTKKKAKAKHKLTLMHGQETLASIQSFTSDFVKQSGVNNTFGGSAVSGIDVQTYGYLGTDIDFIYLPILDDLNLYPATSSITGKQRTSSMFFLLDLDPTMGYEGNLIPAIERFHFDIEGMRYGYIPGTIGPDGGDPSNMQSMGQLLMATDIDGVSSQVWWDGGIDIADAQNMLMWELAS